MISITLVWYQVFWWMKFFESLAAFIHLFYGTIQGLKVFFFITSLLIGLYSNLFYIIDKIDQNGNMEDHFIYTRYFKTDSLNAFIYMYKILLGQVEVDEFIGTDDFTKTTLWITFITATFLLQITLMNMIIAIMGAKFGEIIEHRREEIQLT